MKTLTATLATAAALAVTACSGEAGDNGSTGSISIDGYTATNVVQVETDDLEGVGRLIDVAIEAGANRVQQLSFGLKDDQPVRAEALREATVRASVL